MKDFKKYIEDKHKPINDKKPAHPAYDNFLDKDNHSDGEEIKPPEMTPSYNWLVDQKPENRPYYRPTQDTEKTNDTKTDEIDTNKEPKTKEEVDK